jgi:catechol 2,3-dioxygenase-like lactoylglutathione lyase family enzyme
MPPGGEEQAISFYEAVLGLRFVSGPPYLAHAGGCWFEADAVRVHLSVEHFHPARKGHAALMVDDLPGLVGALTAARHPVIVDETLDGCARVYVKDPFGNRIELFAEPARSPHAQRL